MSTIYIEFFDKSSNQLKYFCFGPSKSLVAFLSGGAVYFHNRNLSSDHIIPITDILNPDECEYVFPMDKTEYYEDEEDNSNAINLNHSEDKSPQQLQSIFKKLEQFYIKPMYELSDAIPPLWQEENVKQTVWDYSYIRDIVSCLEVCKSLTTEIKYYSYEDD